LDALNRNVQLPLRAAQKVNAQKVNVQKDNGQKVNALTKKGLVSVLDRVADLTSATICLRGLDLLPAKAKSPDLVNPVLPATPLNLLASPSDGTDPTVVRLLGMATTAQVLLLVRGCLQECANRWRLESSCSFRSPLADLAHHHHDDRMEPAWGPAEGQKGPPHQ